MKPLPQEIIANILHRLPVKPLLRFRSVSKRWCALIDGPDFIKQHLKRALDTKSNLTLYLGGTGTLFAIDVATLKKVTELPIPDKQTHGPADIIGSCNGLLLLQRKDIALFNQATRQYRVLPPVPIEYPKCYVSSYFEKFGFGYDSVNDDYKVIRIVEFKGMGGRWISSEARIYSLKSNSWGNAEKFPYCLPYKRVWGVHLNGALHTVVNTSSDPNLPEIIVAFDIGAEKCDYIELPDLLDKSYFDITVEVFERCLCVRATYKGDRTDMWVMRVYGVKETWYKLLSIGPPLVKSYIAIYPLAFSKNGGEVLLNYDDKKLIWYNRKKKSVRKVSSRGIPCPFYIEVSVESLVSLSGGGNSEGIKKEVKELKPKEVKEEKPKEVKEEKPKELNEEKLKDVKEENPKDVKEEKPKEKKNKKRDGFLARDLNLSFKDLKASTV